MYFNITTTTTTTNTTTATLLLLSVGYVLLIHEVSRSHTTHQSVGLLWTSDQFVAETSTGQHSQQTNVHDSDGIRTHNLSRRAAADLRLRPHGHWDLHYYYHYTT